MKQLLIAIVLVGCAASPPTPQLATRRAELIAWLHEYREAGVYPLDPTGRPISVFRDAAGRRCAMAELIHRSGHDALVDAIARDDNHLRLADVHAGPVLAWMLASGLTQEEIAMVQGALDIDYQRLQRETPSHDLVLATARGEIRGRLETAETALRDGTAHALEVARARVSAAVAADSRSRAGARTTAASPRTSGSSR